MTTERVMRRFQLHRDQDVTGVSGTGVVADGVLFPDGAVTIRWRGDRPSTVAWACIEDAFHVHAHGRHHFARRAGSGAAADRRELGRCVEWAGTQAGTTMAEVPEMGGRPRARRCRPVPLRAVRMSPHDWLPGKRIAHHSIEEIRQHELQ